MIRDYQIVNFKSVSAASLRLSGADVFLGLNSSGKSSLIQPLLLIRQSAVVGSLPHGRVLLNGPLVTLGTGRDVLYEFAETEETIIAWDGTSVRIPYQPTEDELLAEITGSPVRDDAPPARNVTYLSTARVPPQVLYERYHLYDQASPISGVQGEDAPGFLAAHGNSSFDAARPQRDKGATGSLLEQVTTWMRRVSPQVSIALDELHQLGGLAMRFEFDGEGGVRTRPYRANNVGFGLSHSLGIVLALVAAPSGSLLILEGPEAHLHPRAQRFLGHLIGQAAGDGVQVIVETHSTELVRGLRAAVSSGWLKRSGLTLHYCLREASQTRIAHIQTDHDGRMSDISGYDGMPGEYYREFASE